MAFSSRATNLVPGDTNGWHDIFVHNRETGKTDRASVSSSGDEPNANSMCPSLSADGRFVAFRSYAENLVPGDTNRRGDVFVHDRETGKTEKVSLSESGDQADDLSGAPTISADGRFVAFASSATNLIAGDDNDKMDIFVARNPLAP